MKRYATFPHTRHALETLWGNRIDIRAAFDAEDRQDEISLTTERDAARAENAAYELARTTVRRAQWDDGAAV